VSSSSESSELRKYGLEFIQDLARDRKYAMQSLGVAVSSFKSGMKQSNILNKREDREYVDNLLKSFDKEAKRTVENQLTQITLKSLKWIKNILIRDERIIIKEERKDEELVNQLQGKVESLFTEIQQLNQNNQSLEKQLRDKEADFQELDRNHTRINEELQQQLTIERSRLESQSEQITTHQESIKDFQDQVEDKLKQITTLQEQLEAANLLLIDKNAEISRLNSELKSINESLDATSQDAMAVWAQSYQELEESHQKTLTELKYEYEDRIKNRIEESKENQKNELNNLEQKFGEEKKQLESQIKELEIKTQDFSNKFLEMDSEVNFLTEQKNEYLNEITDNKSQIEKLQKELEEINAQEDEKLKKAISEYKKSTTDLKHVNEYVDKILALSNYAPITILLRMNGEMKLEHLAKSVGMDPIVLDNQLQPLHQRDLIDIRSDGLIVANIPSPDS
jgi:chromosome segregation ATPase